MPRQSRQACKVKQLHPDSNVRPIERRFFFIKKNKEMPHQFKQDCKVRASTIRYKCKTDRNILCLLKCSGKKMKHAWSNHYISIQMQDRWDFLLKCPGNENKTARSNNYIPGQMQDRYNVCWNAPANRTSRQSRTTTSRYKWETDRNTLLLLCVWNAPAI